MTVPNCLTGFRASSLTGPDGAFRIENRPLNPYQVEVTADGVKTARQEVSIRTAVPLSLTFSLALASVETEGAFP